MAAGSTYTPIATTTLGSNQTSVTFNSFSGYTDLILVCGFKNTTSVDMLLRFNSDSGNNYSWTTLSGNGSAAASARGSNTNSILADPGAGGFGTEWSNGAIHIMNYANSTTYKTALLRFNGSTTATGANVGLWRNTAAITSFEFLSSSATAIATGSMFTLYGIAAA